MLFRALFRVRTAAPRSDGSHTPRHLIQPYHPAREDLTFWTIYLSWK